MKVLIFAVVVVCLAAQLAPGQNKAKNESLVGDWICREDGTKVSIRADGSLSINDADYAYKLRNGTIIVAGDEGVMTIPYELAGDRLTVQVEGREMVYERVDPSAKTSQRSEAPNVVGALVGKWCYLSNLTGSNSRMSSRCFVLNADGTYEYSAETSSSGANGSSASQEQDYGRWTATRSTLTSISESGDKTVYPIELRNHPKTGDAMIVVDGDAYVTAYKRKPW